MQTDAQKREKAHAKLLSYGERQALVYLYRDANDALALIVQLWVAQTDEQLRVQIDFGCDHTAQAAFDSLDDESLPHALSGLNLPAMLAQEGVSLDG
jgi:hypothetical protein